MLLLRDNERVSQTTFARRLTWDDNHVTDLEQIVQPPFGAKQASGSSRLGPVRDAKRSARGSRWGATPADRLERKCCAAGRACSLGLRRIGSPEMVIMAGMVAASRLVAP